MSSSTPYPTLSTSANASLLKGITDRRLGLFIKGHFASQNLSSILERQRVSGEEWVRMTVWSAPGETKPSFQEVQESLLASTQAYKLGHKLGPSFSNHWVTIDITIPPAYQQAEEPVLCESMDFYAVQHPFHG